MKSVDCSFFLLPLTVVSQGHFLTVMYNNENMFQVHLREIDRRSNRARRMFTNRQDSL
jgi:hypothetical protein